MKQLALVGAPNCGKSSLFNRLTGKHAHVGNRAGVTVGKESAVMQTVSGEKLRLVDLPGIRALPPVSADERETLRSLREDGFDGVLLVLDATNFTSYDRLLTSLFEFLRSQCQKLIPVLAVFNLCDELERFPNDEALSRALGLPCAAVSAHTGQGIDRLKICISEMLFSATFCKNDCSVCRKCGTESRLRLPSHAKRDVCALLGAVSEKKQRGSDRLDRFLLRPAVGIPLFFLLMLGVLYLVFGRFGSYLSLSFSALVTSPLASLANRSLFRSPVWLRELITVGILGGVGAVLDFLPRLTLLFLLQSVLEQTGVLARVNRLFDKPLSRFGLRGDAMTPLLLGFGCTVPAVLCTRAMKSKEAGRRCATCLPAIACSARMPLCLLLAESFFGAGSWLICAGIWLMGALCFLLLCALSKLFSKSREKTLVHADPLPRWRAPTLRETTAAVGEELRHFLSRAGGIILLTSALIWALASFSPSLRYVGESGTEQSLLAAIGKLMAPLLLPIGLGKWQIAAALLSGLGAKEASLSTLSVLLGCGDGAKLSAALLTSGWFTPASALSFLVFYSLYFPCAATVATLRAEGHRWRSLLPITAFAYLLAWAVYAIAATVTGNF